MTTIRLPKCLLAVAFLYSTAAFAAPLSDNVQKYVNEFEQALQQRNSQLAFAAHKKLVTEAPNDPMTQVVGARIMTLQNNLPGAVSTYQEVLKNHPHHVEATRWLAQIEFQQQPQQALARIDAALKVYPRADALLEMAAELLMGRQQFAQAVPYVKAWADYSSAEEAFPRYSRLALVYRQLNQPSAAADALQTAIDYKFDQEAVFLLIDMYDKAARHGEMLAAVDWIKTNAKEEAKQQIDNYLAEPIARAKAKLLSNPTRSDKKTSTTSGMQSALNAFAASYRPPTKLLAGLAEPEPWMLDLDDYVRVVSAQKAQSWRMAKAAEFYAELGDLEAAYQQVRRIDNRLLQTATAFRISDQLAAQGHSAADDWLGYGQFYLNLVKQQGLADLQKNHSVVGSFTGLTQAPVYELSQRLNGRYHRLLVKYWPERIEQLDIMLTGSNHTQLVRAFIDAKEYEQAAKRAPEGELAALDTLALIEILSAEKGTKAQQIKPLVDDLAKRLSWQTTTTFNSEFLELYKVSASAAKILARKGYADFAQQLITQLEQSAVNDYVRTDLARMYFDLAQPQHAQRILQSFEDESRRSAVEEEYSSEYKLIVAIDQQNFDEAMQHIRAGDFIAVRDVLYTAPLITWLMAEQNAEDLYYILSQGAEAFAEWQKLHGWRQLLAINASKGASAQVTKQLDDFLTRSAEFTYSDDKGALFEAYVQMASALVHRYGNAAQQKKLAAMVGDEPWLQQAQLWGAVVAEREQL